MVLVGNGNDKNVDLLVVLEYGMDSDRGPI